MVHYSSRIADGEKEYSGCYILFYLFIIIIIYLFNTKTVTDTKVEKKPH